MYTYKVPGTCMCIHIYKAPGTCMYIYERYRGWADAVGGAGEAQGAVVEELGQHHHGRRELVVEGD